jgi:hypothetical protein
VVGLRLGCINHALLSARAIAADGCRLIGWIGNRIDPHMARADDNLATLRERLPAPCLGVLPFCADPDPRALADDLGSAVWVIAGSGSGESLAGTSAVENQQSTATPSPPNPPLEGEG